MPPKIDVSFSGVCFVKRLFDRVARTDAARVHMLDGNRSRLGELADNLKCRIRVFDVVVGKLFSVQLFS